MYAEQTLKKTCSKCGVTKEMVCFSKHSRNIGYYQSWCKGCVYLNKRAWMNRNPDKVKDQEARDRSTQQRKEYAASYKRSEKYKRQAHDYAKKTRVKRNKHTRNRSRSDVNFKLRGRLRTRIYIALKTGRFSKGSNTQELLGCSFDNVKKYLEDQFEPWMNWANHGEWHIDHIVPLHTFNLTSLEDQKKAFHYTNLQPLSAHDNLSKNGKCLK